MRIQACEQAFDALPRPTPQGQNSSSAHQNVILVHRYWCLRTRQIFIFTGFIIIKGQNEICLQDGFWIHPFCSWKLSGMSNMWKNAVQCCLQMPWMAVAETAAKEQEDSLFSSFQWWGFITSKIKYKSSIYPTIPQEMQKQTCSSKMVKGRHWDESTCIKPFDAH